MKKTLFFVLLMLLTSVTYFGCVKENTTSSDLSEKINSAGEIHNELLNRLANSGNLEMMKPLEAFSIIQSSLKNEFGDKSNEDYYQKYLELNGNTSTHKFCGEYNNLVLKRFNESNTSSEFMIFAKSIEELINNDKDISSDKRIATLNSLSVLKYSFMYWENQLQDKNSYWYKIHQTRKLDTNNTNNVVAPACPPNTMSNYAFLHCIAQVDAFAYDGTYWSIYNGSNPEYASNQANAMAAYSSGVAGGLGMNIP
jgi:hypothetical protein